MDDLTILGATIRHPLKKLESFPKPDGCTVVTLTASEVTSLCPITGQPDFQTVTITYAPDQKCIESKSLKLYLWSFREEGVFCEQFACTICDDIMDACQPKWCKVEVKQTPRGGIEVSAVAERILESTEK